MDKNQTKDPKKVAKGCLVLLVVSVLIGIIANTCSSKDSSNALGVYLKEKLPDGFEYAIVRDDSKPSVGKNQLLVSINKKLTVGQIATLAEELYDTKPKQDRFYIGYLLPDMKPGSGAWAVSNFEPNIKIEIFGSTSEQDKQMYEAARNIKENVVGMWMENYVTSSIFVLYSKDGKFFLKQFHKEAFDSEHEVIVKRESTYTSIEHVKPEDVSGEHYVINSIGNLDFINSEGRTFATGIAIR